MNVLVVEDEARVADFIQRGLRAEGWIVSVAPDGEAALTLTASGRFDVILLDLMLPGISGQEVCRRLRARNDSTPILMLTARDEVNDRVAGLQMGADDYLTKPFDFGELVARVQALVRRASGFQNTGAAPDRLELGPLSLDDRTLEVRCAGKLVELTRKEREILKLLLSNPGKVFSRERILSSVWKASEDPLTNVVDVYIGRLRKKLGPCSEPIQTVRGIGYRYSAPTDGR